MKKTTGLIYTLFLVLIVSLTGCASMQKAKSLYQEGKNEEALNMAIGYLDEDEDEAVRLDAIQLIGEIGGDRAGQSLVPLMDDSSVRVRNAAIRNIGKIGYEPAADKLVDMALEMSSDTFDEVTVAIRKIGPAAIDPLYRFYSRESDTMKREKYKKVLLAVGPSVASSIAKNMAGKSYFENRANFEILIAFKSPDAAKWLLNDIDNDEVADMVMEGLAKLGRLAETPVIRRLETAIDRGEDTITQERLIEVLGNIKAKKAVELLEDLTTANSDRVRNAADSALKKIRGF